MKPLTYTNAVLTVIAAALMWLCVHNGPSIALAQGKATSPQPTEVYIRGYIFRDSGGSSVQRDLSTTRPNDGIPVTILSPLEGGNVKTSR